MIFPVELWLMIMPLVIEEAIIRVDGCDHTTFPYIRTLLYAEEHRYRSCGTCVRLRLVCRTFNLLVGSLPPYQFTQTHLSPEMPNVTKAVYIDLGGGDAVRSRGLGHASNCQQLVHLDVGCGLHDGESIFDLVGASDVRCFGNVRRLTLRISEDPAARGTVPFWDPLHRVFPLLVTLVVATDDTISSGARAVSGPSGDVSFERLEILHLGRGIPGWGLAFPRLRHASVDVLSHHELDVLRRSPDLESLFVGSFVGRQVAFDLGSLLHPKVLGIREGLQWTVAPFDRGHRLEHLWLFGRPMEGHQGFYDDQGSFWTNLQMFPGISRLTLDLSSVPWRRAVRTSKFQRERERLASLGILVRPPRYSGDPIVEMDCSRVVRRGRGGGI
jgi:hypothetical protein